MSDTDDYREPDYWNVDEYRHLAAQPPEHLALEILSLRMTLDYECGKLDRIQEIIDELGNQLWVDGGVYRIVPALDDIEGVLG